MLSVLLLGVLMVAPASPAPTSDTARWGALHFERSSALTWPGLRAPAFSLLTRRRMVHQFSLGFAPPGQRRFELSVVAIEPDAGAPSMARTLRDPSAQGSLWVGTSVALPTRTPTHLSLGWSRAMGSAAAPTAGTTDRRRAGLGLPRLLLSGRM